MRNRRLLPGRRTLVLLLILGLAPAARAASVIDRAEVQLSTRGSILRFEFVAPIRYVNHAPLKRSAEVDIQLRPVNPSDFDPVALIGREARGLETTEGSPFRAFAYDGSAASGPQLSVSFRQIVDYEIRTAPDLRTLVVIVRPVAAAEPAAPAPAPGLPDSQTPATPRRGYVIHLRSDLKPIDPAREQRLPEFAGLQLFTSQAQVKGRLWNRLNLGPFATRAEANRVLQRLRGKYPDAWISRRAETLPAAAATAASRAPADDAQRMLDRAREAMTAGRYELAIRLYTEVIERVPPEQAREAHELLGLARERNGQFAHAKAEYQTYLRLYPDGEDADRVRQRLAGVLTARPSAAEQAAGGERPPRERPAVWYWNGGLSQYYFRNERVRAEDDSEESTLQSDLVTWINLTGRRRGPRIDLRFQLSASNDRDLLDSENDDDRNDLVPTDLYADILDKRTGLSGRIGRQNLSGSGTQGRFDGLVAGYRVTPSAQVNLVTGYPVDLNDKTRLQSDKPFTGLNLQLGPYAEHWNFSLFAIEREVDGLTDRRAVGGEARYFSPAQSYFLHLDQDLHFDERNATLLLANWTLSESSSLYLTLDDRLSPPLATTNALQGQPVTSIDELRTLFSEAQIKSLAVDRTARVRSLSVGGNHRLPSELQVSLDLTYSETGATQASGGVDAIEATGQESFYTLQFLGDDFLFPLGTTVLTLRYSDTALSRTLGTVLDYRRVFARSWRVQPRLELEYRERVDSEDNTLRLSPLVRLEYRGWRDGEFEVAAGVDWERAETQGLTDETTNAVFNIGYRWDF